MYVVKIKDDIMCRSRSGNKIYWMLTSEIGAPTFELRYIEIPPSGKSSYGHHPHEHEVFICQRRRQNQGAAFRDAARSGNSSLRPRR